MSSFKDMLIEALVCLANFSNGAMMETTKTIMTFSSSDGTIVETVMTYLTVPLGFFLMAIFFLIGLIREISDGKEVGIWSYVKPAIFLVLASFALSESGTIVSTLMGLSNVAGDYIQEQLISSTSTKDTITAAVGDDYSVCTIISLCILLITHLASFALSLIGILIISVVVLSTKIELLVRFAFCPIGLASLADSQEKSRAITYLKKLIATCFYYAAIVVIIYTVSSQSFTIFDAINNENNNIFITAIQRILTTAGSVLMPLAAIGAITTVKSVVNESFGA